MTEHPRVDHVIHVAEEKLEDGDDVVHRAVCSCGWRSYVASTDHDLALRQGYKHGDRLFRPGSRLVNLSLRIDAKGASPEDVAELVKIAERAAT